MKSAEKSTFYLYSLGQKTDVLRLGNLVLRDYANPTLARHHVNKSADHEQEAATAFQTTLGACVFHQKTGWNIASKLDTASIASVGLSGADEGDLVVVAKHGERATLKDPEQYLNEHVLSDAQAAQKLQLWLSAASLDYVKKLLVMRTPKIWVCTGIYMLEAVEVYRVTKKSAGANAGLGSELVAALGAVPLGPSASLGLTKASSSRLNYPEKLVWAAQWQALDVKYARVSSETPDQRLPGRLSLLPDVFSKGTLRASGDVTNAVQVNMATDEGASGAMASALAPEQYNDDLGRELERAIQEMEGFYSEDADL